MSTLKVNTINAATSGQAVAVDVQNPRSFRNLIINGSQDIDQRNSGSEVNPVVHAACVTDRFKFDLSQASKLKAQQVSDGPTGFTKSLKITSLAATTPGASDYYILQHIIEGLSSAHLGWGASGAKTVTLSFWVKSSLTGTFGAAIRNNAHDRTNVQTYAISSADTWEKKTITFTGDTSGTWLTTNGVGLRVGWDLGGGTNFDAASTGSWLATNDFTTSSCTHVVSTNAATWQITGVQLEVGSYATDFEHRSYQDELARCQRYYWQSPGDFVYYSRQYNNSNRMTTIMHPQEMRAIPTETLTYDGGTGPLTTWSDSDNKSESNRYWQGYDGHDYDAGSVTKVRLAQFSAEL